MRQSAIVVVLMFLGCSVPGIESTPEVCNSGLNDDQRAQVIKAVDCIRTAERLSSNADSVVADTGDATAILELENSIVSFDLCMTELKIWSLHQISSQTEQ